MKPLPRRSRRASAFSLIELLLVLVILAILGGLVVTRFSGVGEKAKIQAAHTDINTIESALDAYKISNGKFPTTEEGLHALIEKPASATAAATEWPYLKKEPVDPWGKAYIYKCPPEQNKADYDLSSGGPDGQPGGNDDITNWN